MNQVQAIINFAKSQIGYKEIPVNKTKYAEEIDAMRKQGQYVYNYPKNGVAWCDIFVDYCFIHSFGFDRGLNMLCQPERSAGAGCKFSRDYYKRAGRLFDSPEEGDQIFFGNDSDIYHTGIVTKVANGRVYTIEGNSSDQVREHSYMLTNPKIKGYGRPRWDEEKNQDSEPEIKEPEIPETTKPNNSDEYYTVRKGDTLYGIAKKFGTTVAELQGINRISNPNLIYPNQRILIPKRSVQNQESQKVVNTFMGKVNTNRLPLRVRSGAGTSYKIIKLLPKGSKIELYSEKINGWYKLTDGSGFVASNYIVKI